MREHKKFSLGILGWAMILTGAMSLGSCSSDETLESIEPKAITFGSVTLENSSRATDPSYGDSNPIDQFKVWGSVKGNTGTTVNVFSGATVRNQYLNDTDTDDDGYGQAWTCDVAQYWIPSAEYNFMAISNANSVTTGTAGMPTAINFTLDKGSTDLLLSEKVTAKTDGSATPTTGVNANKCVAFNMTHLLSKVHFTFDGSASNVKYIQVTGHYGSGTYTIGADNPWGSQDLAATTSPLSFGGLDTQTNDNTSENARLIIPGKQTWTIKLLDSSKNPICEPITLNKGTATGTTETEGFTFEPNTQYNINISLGVDMKLSVSVQPWELIAFTNEFSKTVTVNAEGKIVWANDTKIEGNTVVMKNDINSPAEFTFCIAGPLGGTWKAFLYNLQGDATAFSLSQYEGAVGTPYTIRIKANSKNTSQYANKAELRFVVQMGQDLIPVNNLTTLADGGNYIILQNISNQN